MSIPYGIGSLTPEDKKKILELARKCQFPMRLVHVYAEVCGMSMKYFTCQFPMRLVHSTVHRQYVTILARFRSKSSTFWRQSKQIYEMTKMSNNRSSNSSSLILYNFILIALLIDRQPDK